MSLQFIKTNEGLPYLLYVLNYLMHDNDDVIDIMNLVFIYKC